jgi:hypothetical protein
VVNELNEKGTLRMISTNTEYEPYDLPVSEIREVWKFVHYISDEVPEVSESDKLHRQIELIKTELKEIKEKL